MQASYEDFWTLDQEELLDSCERTGAIVLRHSCDGQTDVWEPGSDNCYLSVILDRQVLMVAAPVDLRTKKAESFSPQALQGSWSKMKIKNPKVVMASPTVLTKYTKQKEVIWQQYRLCLAIVEYQNLVCEHFLILGPESGKIWWVKKVQYLQKKYHCKWTLLRGKKPKWIFSQFRWTTCQRCILFNNMGSFIRKSELRKPENVNKPICQVWKFQCRWIVTPQGILGKQLCSYHHDGSGWQSTNRCNPIILGLRLSGMPLEQK